MISVQNQRSISSILSFSWSTQKRSASCSCYRNRKGNFAECNVIGGIEWKAIKSREWEVNKFSHQDLATFRLAGTGPGGAPTGLSYIVKRRGRGRAGLSVVDICTGSLRDLLEEEGLVLPTYIAGQHRLRCPQCAGGKTRELSLALRVNDDGASATWMCHRSKCGWQGFLKENNEDDSSFPRYQPRQKGWPNAAYMGNGSVNPRSPGNIDTGYISPSLAASQGFLDAQQQASKKKFSKPPGRPPKLDHLNFEDLDEEMLKFFEVRGISLETIARNQIKQEFTFCPQQQKKVKALAFPYLRNGDVVNCKYRAPVKQFWQVKGGERVLYGVDDIKGQNIVIIVEGEMDKLSVEEAGFRNCVSVPDGAPSRVRPMAEGEVLDPTTDTKYEYLWNCKEHLDKAKKIVLATDADEPGNALAEELARRLGRERCWRVRWPMKDEENQCKDANEVLLEKGSEALRDCLLGAELIPIRGLFRFRDYFDEIDQFYRTQNAEDLCVSTGWRSLDETYRVVEGELTVVTGVPNSGKSEWIDALICNLCLSHGWTFALCSMENKVKEHARKLIEKYVGKPFIEAPYARNVPRMSLAEMTVGKEWVDSNFHVIRCENDELPSIEWVLSLARAAVLRFGIRGLVIDPYNELDHQRHSQQTETEYVSQMLTKVKRFAQHHDCHVWFVAHPKQLQQWKGDPPGLYDISGSAHFVNKCDNGIVIHRNRDPEMGPLDHVQVLVRKVRNKAAGTIGDAVLRYDRVTGRYYDVDDNLATSEVNIANNTQS